MIRCVLFDLDGTLADTAPDLNRALNCVRAEEGLPPIALETTRSASSQGVRGLLRVGFDMSPAHPAYSAMTERVLHHYAAGLCETTTIFAGIGKLLDDLDDRGIRWGIVTNKHARFTEPLVAALGLATRAACVVSGDTAARPKPAPDPLLLASTHTGIAPSATVYVGDDERDIVAGRAAGMLTIAAGWGYIGAEVLIEAWNAHAIAATPQHLMDAIHAAAVQSGPCT